MDGTDRRSRARVAIQTLAQKQGLPDELTVLSERWNTVAMLGESGVIAKCATLADLVLVDPLRSFRIEVEVCSTLADRGAPVHRPYAFGLYVIDGFPITLWHEVQGEMGEATEHQLVDSLVQLHRVGGEMLIDEPWFSTITTHFTDVFPRLRARRVVDAITLNRLEDNYQRLIEQVAGADLTNSLIHGDAQRKNAMATDSGAVWIDFEECSYGPIAWDLACLTMHRRFETDRVLNRYADVSGTNRISNADIEILKRLRELEALTWMLAIQHEREPAFRVEAADLLTKVLGTASGD